MASRFTYRCDEKELIDLGKEYYTQEEFYDCQKKLASIGTYLGGNRASYHAFKKLSFTPTSILDVGCGGGAFIRYLAKKFPKAKMYGADTCQEVIDYARANTSDNYIEFIHMKTPNLDFSSNSFDIITATLLCHHMDTPTLLNFLENALDIAKKSIIINDLHRSPLAYYSFKCLAQCFFRNRLVLHDGPLSVRRAFKKVEWEKLLTHFSSKNIKYSIKWKWAYRWVITIQL